MYMYLFSTLNGRAELQNKIDLFFQPQLQNPENQWKKHDNLVNKFHKEFPNLDKEVWLYLTEYMFYADITSRSILTAAVAPLKILHICLSVAYNFRNLEHV